MSTAITNLRVSRNFGPTGQTRGPLSITVIIHSEDDCWWAESPQLPGLSIAEATRDELLAALRPAVQYYIEETPDLKARHVAMHIMDEHLGIGEVAWREAHTA